CKSLRLQPAGAAARLGSAQDVLALQYRGGVHSRLYRLAHVVCSYTRPGARRDPSGAEQRSYPPLSLLGEGFAVSPVLLLVAGLGAVEFLDELDLAVSWKPQILGLESHGKCQEPKCQSHVTIPYRTENMAVDIALLAGMVDHARLALRSRRTDEENLLFMDNSKIFGQLVALEGPCRDEVEKCGAKS
ncbi:Homeobox-leucine zipper protein ATHB-9, partial [Frankliniella fusca]